MDFAVIAQRIKEQFCKPDTEEAANTALSYMVNGEYFSDIDYSSGAPGWVPLLAHLTRVGALCACYSFLPNSRLYRDVSVKQKIISCLTFWFTHDFSKYKLVVQRPRRSTGDAYDCAVYERRVAADAFGQAAGAAARQYCG